MHSARLDTAQRLFPVFSSTSARPRPRPGPRSGHGVRVVARSTRGLAGRRPVHAQAAPSTTLTWSVRPTPVEGTASRPNFSFDVEGGDRSPTPCGCGTSAPRHSTLALYASDALTSKSGALDLLPAGTKPEDVGAWIHLDTDSVSLEPGQFVDVPFTMAVPPNARVG